MTKATLITALLFLPFAGSAQTSANATQKELDHRFQQGEQARQHGAYEKAIGFYDQVLQSDPNYLNAYLQRGFCHSIQREYKEAVADFTSVIARKSDHLWAYTSRGSAYTKLGKPDLAIQDFNRVLELDPGNQEAFNNRGWAKKELGDAKGACKDWQASRRAGNAEAKIILKNNRCK